MRLKELQARYPHIKNDNFGFVGLIVLLMLALGLIYLAQKNNNNIYIALILFLIPLGYLIGGIRALYSRVFGYSSRSVNSARYFYDEDKKFSWIAKLQIIVSALVLLLITYIIYLVT